MRVLWSLQESMTMSLCSSFHLQQKILKWVARYSLLQMVFP